MLIKFIRRTCLCLIWIMLLVELSSGQTVKRPALEGIAFVELQVADINKSIHFYRDLLGYRISQGYGHPIHSFEIVISQRQRIKIQDGLPSGQDERLLAVAFQTGNAEAMRLYLGSRGMQVPQSVNRQNSGMLWFAVTDPDKHTIKFVEQRSNVDGYAKPAESGAISGRILHAGLTI